MKYNLALIFISIFCFTTFSQDNNLEKTLDSIQQLRQLSENSELDIKERLKYAEKSFDLALSIKNDSIALKNGLTLGKLYIISNKLGYHLSQHHKNLKLAKHLNDTVELAYIYGNLGWNYNYTRKNIDSAYFYYNKSLILLKKLNFEKSEAEVLNNIASLQMEENLYIEAETNLVKALGIITTLKNGHQKFYDLYLIYNLLGVLNKKMGNFDKAMHFYNKALDINSKLPKHPFRDFHGNLVDSALNYIDTTINIAQIFNKKGSYEKANTTYTNLLKKYNVKEKDISSYVVLLANLAYSKFLAKHTDTKKIESLFKKALKNCDSQDLKYEKTAIGNYLSEFYLSINKKELAITYLNKSLQIGKQIKQNQETLKSLKLLSQAVDGEAGKQYLYEYIKLNDSLLNRERNIRNKFARIRFETDEIIAKNKKITKDKSALTYTAFGLLLFLITLYIIYIQRIKNKELLLIHEQQKANQEIFALMRMHQTKIQKSKSQERQRISEELHDGILGRLFGIRINLTLLSNKIKTDSDNFKKYHQLIDEIQQTEIEIRQLTHDMNKQLLNDAISFKDIIEEFLKSQTQLHSLNYSFFTDPSIDWSKTSDTIKVELYRIIQEIFFNTVKHAKASHIKLSFTQSTDEHLVLVIEDDGIGFDTNKTTNGIGLKNLESRVSKLNGKLDINSAPGNGTEISITVVPSQL